MHFVCAGISLLDGKDYRVAPVVYFTHNSKCNMTYSGNLTRQRNAPRQSTLKNRGINAGPFKKGEVNANGRGGDNGLTIFVKAAGNNDVTTMKAIIAAHPNIPETKYVLGTGALLSAATQGHVAATRYLLSIGGEEATRDRSGHNGETPLHRAALYGHAGVVELLLKYKADVGAVADRSQYTAADYAGCNKHKSIVDLLIKARSDDPRPEVCAHMQGVRKGGRRKTQKRKERKMKSRRR
jgi:ankyrin repeat protein